MSFNIENFANELNELIERNRILTEQLKHTEEYLKLAICKNSTLQFQKLDNAEQKQYQEFIDNTIISYGSELTLLWKQKVNVEGFGVCGYSTVSADEIHQVMNSLKNERD